jgi:hypothetical protein
MSIPDLRVRGRDVAQRIPLLARPLHRLALST